jgi:predicted ATP-grasp superfamily ATP-dependent carboligase
MSPVTAAEQDSRRGVLGGFERFAAQLTPATPAAFILGADRAHGLAMARSLGRRGIPVVRLGTSGTPGMKSRFGFAVPIDGLDPPELVALLRRLGEKLPSRGALLPTSDAHVLLLSHHAEQLSAHFRFVLPKREILESLADKRLQHILAAQCGIETPQTWAPKSIEELAEVAAEICFPCVVKPAHSDEWNRYRLSQPAESSLGKVIVADTRELLFQAYELMTGMCSGVIVQELIEGDADQLYAVYAHCAEEGVVSALCVRREIRDWPVSFGSGSYSVSVIDPDSESLARKFLEFTRYRGLANIEFKRDPHDGRLKLIEFNVRGASQLAIAVDSGVDLPFAAYSSIVGRSVGAVSTETSRTGVRWIDFGTDALAVRKHRQSGNLRWGVWIRDMLRARSFAYFAADDLRPAVARSAELLRGAFTSLTRPR